MVSACRLVELLSAVTSEALSHPSSTVYGVGRPFQNPTLFVHAVPTRLEPAALRLVSGKSGVYLWRRQRLGFTSHWTSRSSSRMWTSPPTDVHRVARGSASLLRRPSRHLGISGSVTDSVHAACRLRPVLLQSAASTSWHAQRQRAISGSGWSIV